MDVAEAIDGEAVAVKYRTVAPSFDQSTGKTAKLPTVPVEIRAVIQPASGRQLMDVPEGVRTEARYLAWSRAALVEDGQILYFGEWFRIVYSWPRPQDGFYRAAIGRLKNAVSAGVSTNGSFDLLISSRAK